MSQLILLILRRFTKFETQTFPNGVIEVKISSELIANSYRKKLKGAADSIFNNPSSREFSLSETSLAREGVFEGVHVRVIFSPDGSINTVYPIRPPDQRNLH